MARIKSKMPCRLIAIKLVEDETTGVASKLNIIKICSRRQSKLIDQALMQTSNYPSLPKTIILPLITVTLRHLLIRFRVVLIGTNDGFK